MGERVSAMYAMLRYTSWYEKSNEVFDVFIVVKYMICSVACIFLLALHKTCQDMVGSLSWRDRSTQQTVSICIMV